MSAHPGTIRKVQEDRAKNLAPGLHLILSDGRRGLVLRTRPVGPSHTEAEILLDVGLEPVIVKFFNHQLLRAS